MNDPIDLALIDELQIRYITALDHGDWEGWLSCFDQEASYICITRENVEQGLPIALMMDDCAERLRDRVTFITKVWAGTFEEYATRHFVQRLVCTHGDAGRYSMKSNFMLVYTSRDGQSEVLTAGNYQDEVAIRAGQAYFVSKRAVLDTVTVPRYLVYPV